MSNHKPSDSQVKSAQIGCLGLIIAAIITGILGSWDKIFPASPSLSLISAEGEWTVIEKLKSEDPAEINWKYSSKIVKNTFLSMKGRKMKVNDKKTTKEESEVVSNYILTFKDYKAEGKYDESNAKNPILSGVVKLTFTETFTSFTGSAYENGREVSTLHGFKQ
jgi:hypothetical protein